MLFSSLIFIFGYLPLALAGFFLTARIGTRIAGLWVVAASLVFYGWWSPPAVLLLLASIALNYGCANAIIGLEQRPRLQAAITAAGVTFNVAALVYYKYLFTLVTFIHGFVPELATIDPIVLPLGISFFTFTQIGYLIDCKAGLTRDRNPLNYMLFVTFFPHLIAGPILHNRDIMPQFADARTYRADTRNIAVGLTIFVIGLLKKTAGADPLSAIVHDGYAHTGSLDLVGAWNLALAYSLQLYFDFSGYSDMAVGLARMMNITFPRNFESPYKARNVIDYWQRWHVSLTAFLTSYVYTPIALAVMRHRARRRLGINRAAQMTVRGFASMFGIPLMVTMTLAGIWHGSGLTFLIFGALHGVYLCICHAWRLRNPNPPPDTWVRRLGFIALTYLSVLVGSIFFRAPSVTGAAQVLAAMTGLHGLRIDLASAGSHMHILHMALLFAIVWGMPNSLQIMARYQPVLGTVEPPPRWFPAWSPGWTSAAAIGLAATLGILALGGTTEFLYFQF